jgi:outer membrane protein assembly factor BamB
MSNRWISTVGLSCAIAALFFTACKKKFSSDNPLPTSNYPSVVISSDNNIVYGIDPTTGKPNWQYSMPNNTGSTSPAFKPSPLVYHNAVYMVSAATDTIYKLDANTGKLIKKLLVTGNPFFTMIATPIADNNLLYLATTNDTLYAIDTGTGAIKWKFGAQDNSSFNSSPVILNNNIYVATVGAGIIGAGSVNGHVYCLDKSNGPDLNNQPIWDYPGQGVVSNASFISSPAISAPYIYVGSASDSNMYCIYLTPPPPLPTPPPVPLVGVARWTYKTGGNILSSPTCYAGICIFGSNDFYVYCLDTNLVSIMRPSTSNFRWKFRTNGQVKSSPIISNQVVYAGSFDYNLYAINIINGQKKWAYQTKALIKSSPIPYNGRVYVGSYDNYLYAVDTAMGILKWSFYVNGNIECSPAINDLSGTNQINSGISGYNTSGNTN